MFTITAEELNKLVYPKSCESRELEHTAKYKKLRNRYAGLSEEQFAQLYRDFIGTSGTICGRFDAERFQYDEKEADMISGFINDYIRAEFTSFTDMFETFASDCRRNATIGWISSYRLRKALYAICDDGLCPEIECFKVKTLGKTHIRMFRKKIN